MAFSTSYEDMGPELVPEGDYETVIENAMETATQRGYPYISVRCRIRGDVPQDCRGKLIFYDLWPKKNPTQEDEAVNGYSFKQIMSLSRAAELANGAHFSGMDDWCDALVGRAVRLSVEHSEYNGRTSARVKWANPTNHPEVAYPPQEHPAQSAAPAPAPAARRSGTARAAAPKPAAPSDFRPLEDDDDIPF